MKQEEKRESEDEREEERTRREKWRRYQRRREEARQGGVERLTHTDRDAIKTRLGCCNLSVRKGSRSNQSQTSD